MGSLYNKRTSLNSINQDFTSIFFTRFRHQKLQKIALKTTFFIYKADSNIYILYWGQPYNKPTRKIGVDMHIDWETYCHVTMIAYEAVSLNAMSPIIFEVEKMGCFS